MRIKIIHPDSPFHHHEGVVTRVRHNAHVDLNVLLDNGARIIIDALHTDYWTQKGEQPPEVAHIVSLKQVQVEAAERQDRG